MDPWDEAFLRVESYLHAHQIESRLELNRLATEVIAEARILFQSRPDEHPVTLAIEVVHRRMAEWFRRIYEIEGGARDEHQRARGRLGLLSAAGSVEWTPHFLDAEPVPAPLVSKIRETALQPGPEVRMSKMPPAELEFAFGDADDKTPILTRWGAYPAVATCVLIVSAMAVAWTATH
jgi:hypothetical protein